jgi:hypothetical protein
MASRVSQQVKAFSVRSLSKRVGTQRYDSQNDSRPAALPATTAFRLLLLAPTASPATAAFRLLLLAPAP